VTTITATVTAATASTTTDRTPDMTWLRGPGRRSLPGPVPFIERGFALLIVLWVLGFLALLIAHFTALGRAETSLAGNQRSAAQVEAATAGAIRQQVFDLLRGSGVRSDMHITRQIRLGATSVTLSVEDEGARLNPNLAEAPELTALLQQLGVAPPAAAAIAAGILDWRTSGTMPRPGGAKLPQYQAAGRAYAPPAAPFQDIDELGLVLGVTRAVLDRLRPHMTVFTDFNPIGASADPVVTQALQAAAPPGALPQSADLGAIAVARITATGRGPADATVTLRAIVRLNATSDGLPFEFLSWQQQDGGY
jgi:general secretion pathway protein K